MRFLPVFAAALVGLLVAVAPAPAASVAQSVSASANVAAIAKLSVSPGSLLFPDADPDRSPSIAPSTGPVAITARARSTPGAQVVLTMLAGDDLRSGMATIPIAALTWTATGDGFVNGTASRTSPQIVGTWVGSGIRVGSQNFALANNWDQPSGTYTVTLTYTLTAP